MAEPPPVGTPGDLGSRSIPATGTGRQHSMTKIAAIRRRALVAVATLAVTIGTVAEPAAAQQVRPANVFNVSPSLAIEAARTRLRLFVEANPEAVDGSTVANQPECPLISVESFSGLAN